MARRNSYFENMSSSLEAYYTQVDGHKNKKQHIVDTYGIDSDEFTKWSQVKASFKCPFDYGAREALKAWENSEHMPESELEMEDFLFDDDVESFVKALLDAGIKSFVFTNKSTALMDNIHAFEKFGYSLDGTCTVERIKKASFADEHKEVLGLRFKAKQERM